VVGAKINGFRPGLAHQGIVNGTNDPGLVDGPAVDRHLFKGHAAREKIDAR